MEWPNRTLKTLEASENAPSDEKAIVVAVTCGQLL
jgi:hypothetical protein